MAKKPVSRKKISVAASSSKTGKVSAKTKSTKSISKSYAKSVSSKKKSVKAKSSKRVNYRQEYIKLLEKNNKLLTKEVKAIRKAIEQPEPKKIELPPDFEAFPKEDSPVPPSVQARPIYGRREGTIEEEILGKLSDIEMQIRSRDAVFDDLVHGSPKLTGGLNG